MECIFQYTWIVNSRYKLTSLTGAWTGTGQANIGIEGEHSINGRSEPSSIRNLPVPGFPFFSCPGPVSITAGINIPCKGIIPANTGLASPSRDSQSVYTGLYSPSIWRTRLVHSDTSLFYGTFSFWREIKREIKKGTSHWFQLSIEGRLSPWWLCIPSLH